jgi:hypothetical protein
VYPIRHDGFPKLGRVGLLAHGVAEESRFAQLKKISNDSEVLRIVPELRGGSSGHFNANPGRERRAAESIP